MADFQSWMEAQANRQNAFNKQMTEQTNAFNAAEAQKDRDWQEEMSNTALARKMADAERAGLNPIFAVNAQGATTPTGSKATGDSPKEATDIIQAMTSYTNTMEQLRNQKEIAQMQIQAQVQAAQIAANATIAAANAAAAASRYSADRHYAASTYGSDKGYESSKYQSDKSLESNVLTKGVNPLGVAWMNPNVNYMINGMINDFLDPVQQIKDFTDDLGWTNSDTFWFW